MNIFNKYGIREVADVTFYSITRVGEEEFYTPVLFFDSLKVSTIDKNVENVNAKGGKGNGKVISWSFDKDVKLKLEDALFSQMSLDMFMNGRVAAKLSDWTSAIAKLNVANKYGQKNYSVKAYPSPKLTKEEEEIVFRCAQKVGYNPKTGVIKTVGINEYTGHEGKYLYDTENWDEEEDSYVAENRKFLMEHYYKRNQPAPRAYDLSQYLDCNTTKYDGIQIMLRRLNPENELEEAKEFYNLEVGQQWGGWRDLVITYQDKEESGYNLITRETRKNNVVVQLNYAIKKLTNGFQGLYAYISAIDPDLSELKDILTGYYKKEEGEEEGAEPTFHIGDEFFLSHLPYFIFPNYLEDAIGDLCWCDQRDKFYLAMPQSIIDMIAQEMNDFSKIGKFENDLYEAQNIDRFEKCIVDKKEGMKIDLVKQTMNIKKLYNNEMDNYIVYYDAKTMLPFMFDKVLDEKIYSQKCVRYFTGGSSDRPYLDIVKRYFRNQYPDEWVDALTEDDFVINRETDQYGHLIAGQPSQYSSESFQYVNGWESGEQEIQPTYGESPNMVLIYFNLVKRDYLTLKYGTVYYKWSRTIDDDNNDLTFIGTDLLIDADTFSGEYMIVGETLIREQRTGKDQRYQFLLSRAAISASTKIQLQAGGSPTTFSIDVDVLQPLIKDKAAIELRQYNVEKDEAEGGYKIVPQNKNHVYTPMAQTYKEIVIDNNEIF